MDGHVGASDLRTGRKLPELAGIEGDSLRMRIADFTAGVAVEMDMLVQVGAVAGLGAIHIHLFDQSAGGEMFQTVVNRGQRDARRPVLDPVKNVIGRWMVI